MLDQARKAKDKHEQANIKEEKLFESKSFSSFVKTYTLDNGEIKRYQTLEHNGAVAIVAIDEHFVYFVEQYRVAAKKIMLELPAGIIDSGESKEDAAIRELQEEIGKKCKELIFLKTIYTSPGILNEQIHIFLATNLMDSQLYAEDTEEINVIKIPKTVALDLSFISTLEDAKTIIGLMALQTYAKNLS